MSVHVIEYEFHTAYLHPLTGSVLLVMPDPKSDALAFGESLRSSALMAVVRDLGAAGWELSEGEIEGEMVWEADTPAGLPVVGLCGLEPISSNATIVECAEAYDELRSSLALR